MPCNHDVQEIKEIVSAIKKIVNENLWMDSWAIGQIHQHLCQLKNFLTNVDNSADLSSVVSDFIDSTSNLPDVAGTHLQNKLTLKSNIVRLEEEFRNFQRKVDLFQQLCLVSRFDHCESDK